VGVPAREVLEITFAGVPTRGIKAAFAQPMPKGRPALSLVLATRDLLAKDRRRKGI
jgi:hypothetical protein